MYLSGSLLVLLLATFSASQATLSADVDINVNISFRGSASVVLDRATAYWLAAQQYAMLQMQSLTNLAGDLQTDLNVANGEHSGFCKQARALLEAFQASGGKFTWMIRGMLDERRTNFYGLQSNLTTRMEHYQSTYHVLVLARLTKSLECARKQLQALEALRGQLSSMSEEQIKSALVLIMAHKAQFLLAIQSARASFYTLYGQSQDCLSNFRANMYEEWSYLQELFARARILQSYGRFTYDWEFGVVSSTETATTPRSDDTTSYYYDGTTTDAGDYNTEGTPAFFLG
jgi:hypothetical protein